VLSPARQRPLHALVAILTLVALLSLPLSAFGAKGTGLTADVVTLSSKVTLGQYVAWRVTFINSGKATLSGLQFSGEVDGPGTAQPADFNWATSPCGGADQFVSCSFGSVPAKGELDLVFVFETLVTGDLTFSGTFSAEAKNGTPGAKQDTWSTGDSTPADVRPASEEFYGGWQVDGVDTTLDFTFPGATQQSKLGVPPVNSQYWVSFGHIDANVGCTSGDVTGSISGYGLAVDMSVNNGQSPVTVEITFAKEAGLNASTVKLVHENNGKCTLPPKIVGCAVSPALSCFEPSTEGTGSNQRVKVFVKLEHNGRLKGW
jgi:hypothetical protein